jgi:hypothetical protein
MTERGEGEAPAALDDLGDAVDARRRARRAGSSRVLRHRDHRACRDGRCRPGSAASALGSWHQMFLISVCVLI